MYEMPFPSDMRLKSDGTLDLSGFSNPSQNSLLKMYIDIIGPNTKGWGTNSTIYFRFSSAVLKDSLPADPAATLTDGASVFLMDVDARSPERSRRIPLLWRYYETATVFVPKYTLALHNVSGFPLRPSTTYAAVITNGVRDSRNVALGSPLDLEKVKQGSPLGSADEEKARALHAPVFDYLATKGVSRSRISGIAVITTQDPVGDMFRIRDYIHRELPAPTPTELTYDSNKGLYHYYKGTYSAWNFQHGDPPYVDAEKGGDIRFDANGDPIPFRLESLRFALTVPATTAPATGWPIVLYSHGTGGSYKSFINNDTAKVLANEGLAVIGIDQVLHGPRAPVGTNEELFFNYLNPLAGRDNTRQGAVDNFHLIRMVAQLTIPEAVSHTGQVIPFDKNRIMFVGHSQGGITGPPFLAVEPMIKGMVLSGAGGGLGISILYKSNGDIKELIEIALGIKGQEELDRFHPVINLLQLFIEPADTMNYAPLFLHDVPQGLSPRPVFITEGLGDTYTPNDTTEALAIAARVDIVNPIHRPVSGFSLIGKTPINAPVTNNAAGGQATGVLVQYQVRQSSNGHYVAFNEPEAIYQVSQFLSTLAKNGKATLPTQ